MKRAGILFSILSAAVFGTFAPAWGDQGGHNAVFSMVTGRVKVKGTMGAIRVVEKGNKAYTGETIEVGPKAQAQLTLFDGSTLDLSPNTRIKLGVLKAAGQDKTIFLHLDLGKLFAKVRKLFSSHSSFEVEAGGTVCGVRGTAFGESYDPNTKFLDLNVTEGTVGVTSGSVTVTFTAGQKGHFVNGQLTGSGGTGNGSGKGGGKGSGGNTGGNNNNNGGNGSGGNNGGNGGGNNNNGGNGTEGNNGGNPGGGTPDTGNPGGSSSGLGANSALGDLNTTFTTGLLINGDNSLSSAQQTVNIHLVIP